MLLTAIVCILLTLMLGWWVFTATPEPWADGRQEIETQARLERKKAAYDNLKDLHFEHLAGKLSPEDFQRMRQMLEREAAAAAEALDSPPQP